jgi:hypothetical protein
MIRLVPLVLLAGCWLDGYGADLSDLVDLSVNAASATADSDGLHLRTEAGTNPVGGFNGAGTGNKAIAGIEGYDGLLLADLTGAAYETAAVTGDSAPYLNLVVDLDCTGADLRVVVADATLATATPTAGGALRYAFLAEAPQWKAVGGLDELLPSHLASTGGALTDVVAAWPAACLRDAATGDNGLPAGVVTPSVLIILGDSVNELELEHTVSAVEVGLDRFEAL